MEFKFQQNLKVWPLNKSSQPVLSNDIVHIVAEQSSCFCKFYKFMYVAFEQRHDTERAKREECRLISLAWLKIKPNIQYLLSNSKTFTMHSAQYISVKYKLSNPFTNHLVHFNPFQQSIKCKCWPLARIMVIPWKQKQNTTILMAVGCTLHPPN